MSRLLQQADNPLKERRLQERDVWVLGGGVSGLTTAVILQSLGLRTAILADSFPAQSSGQHENPIVATSYAMASAYPHNLQVESLEEISRASQAIFAQLERQPASGVRIYRMFEVFESEPGPAPLSHQRINFQMFDGAPHSVRSLNPPVRPGAKYIWGFSFDTYFADMPVYMPFLWSYYTSRGGIFQSLRFTLDQILESARHQVLLNCLGAGAIEAAGDKSPAVIMRGAQVIVPEAQVVTTNGGTPVAYNYTPPPEVYSRGDGTPEYVHFFPRSDGWILGQTREPGRLTGKLTWEGAAVRGAQVSIAGVSIPEPIVTLNRAILSAWKEIKLQQSGMRARAGYRYYRDPSGTGVRLEAENRSGTTIIHNYGHGGSGITMSWGCGIRCADLLFAAHPDLRTPASRSGAPLEQAFTQQLQLVMK